MRKTIIFLIALTMAVLLSACSDVSDGGAQPVRSLSVLTWNVQALFDGHDDGIEYDEYRAEQGWNEEKFLARRTAIAEAISQTPVDGGQKTFPDVAVLIELENETILSRLAENEFAKANYHYGYFTKKSGQALGTGILSRYPIIKALSHGYARNEKTIPRPVSEVWIEAGGEPFVILVCHWKSKLGNAAESQALRYDAAALIRRIYEDLYAEQEAVGKPAVPILLAGDFNQTADEFFASDFPFTVTHKQEDFASVQDAPAWGDALFWTPWGTALEGGSYYYRGAWESIDHFFLSGAFFDDRAWDFAGVSVLRDAPWVGESGIPLSYNPRTGGGLSDHLPLLLTLTLTQAVP
jgi:endonuclease/exonuclease/phosphatase family metal-dependent hydrolase